MEHYACLVNLVNLLAHYAGLLKLLDHDFGVVKLLDQKTCLVKRLEHHMHSTWKSSPVIWKERGTIFANVCFMHIT